MAAKVLRRLPDLRLAADDEALPLRPASFVSGLESMPMVFTPSSPVSSWSRRAAPLLGGHAGATTGDLQAARNGTITLTCVPAGVSTTRMVPPAASTRARCDANPMWPCASCLAAASLDIPTPLSITSR
jgi:hypothetical protein